MSKADWSALVFLFASFLWPIIAGSLIDATWMLVVGGVSGSLALAFNLRKDTSSIWNVNCLVYGALDLGGGVAILAGEMNGSPTLAVVLFVVALYASAMAAWGFLA